MAEQKIEVSDTSVRVTNLEIRNKDISDYLRVIPEEEREQNFVRAVEVGVFVLREFKQGRTQSLYVVRWIPSFCNLRTLHS